MEEGYLSRALGGLGAVIRIYSESRNKLIKKCIFFWLNKVSVSLVLTTEEAHFGKVAGHF